MSVKRLTLKEIYDESFNRTLQYEICEIVCYNTSVKGGKLASLFGVCINCKGRMTTEKKTSQSHAS